MTVIMTLQNNAFFNVSKFYCRLRLFPPFFPLPPLYEGDMVGGGQNATSGCLSSDCEWPGIGF